MSDAKTFMKWMARTKGRKRPRAHPKNEPPIKSQEREYVKQMLPVLNSLKELVEVHLVRQLPKIYASYDNLRPDRTRTRNDASDDDIKSAMKQIKVAFTRDFTEKEIEDIAAKRGISVAELNKQFLEKGVKHVLDIDVFSSEPYLTDEISVFATNNANLITSMTDQWLDKVENLAYSALSDGTSVDEVQDQIMDLIDPEKVVGGNIRARAELIARDQVGKLNGQLNELRQTELGVERYTWRSTHDERVREMHRELDGQVFTWDDPPVTNPQGDRNHPGGDYQCRCWAEPVLSDLVEGIDDDAD